MTDSASRPRRRARAFNGEARVALAAIGRRAEVARRLELGSAEAVLRSVVEAAVVLFEAEAASIALYEPARNLLVFRVAAGEQGQGVVGLEIAPDRGLVGYVFSSGQALAIADVRADPRFGRSFAEQTQYVPRSIVAVPLVDERGTLGVLEVLDKRSEATFSLRDIELAGVFARQATVAIRASRVERDAATLLRSVLRSLAGDDASEQGVEALVEAALAEVGDPDDPLWPLVEQIAALRRAGPEQQELLSALLDVLVRQSSRGRGRRAGRLRAPGG
jgi:GAF domain-containing protein